MSGAKYLDHIDGIRALAVTLVVLYHTRLAVHGGFLGVDVFFVISGYLIAKTSIPKEPGKGFDLVGFWSRRTRRLLPALAVCLLTTLVAGYVLFTPSHLEQLADAVVYQSYLCSNLYFLNHLEAGYFSDGLEVYPTLHTWSLSVEEQFYLTFSFVMYLGLRRLQAIRPLRLLGAVLGLLALSLTCSHLLLRAHARESFFILPSRMWEFLAGMLLEFEDRRSGPPLRTQLAQILGWLGLALILVPALSYSDSTPFPGMAAFPPVAGTALLIYSQKSGKTSLGRLLAWGPLRAVGQMSYSIYLWHWPVFTFFAYWRGYWGGPSAAALLITVTMAISWMSYCWIELPLRHRLSPKRSGMVIGCLVISNLLLSTGFSVTNGAARRYNAEELDWLRQTQQWRARAEEGKVIWLGDKSKSDFLVWGDSHAGALLPCLQEIVRSRHCSGILLTHSASPPLIQVDHRFSGWGLAPDQQAEWARSALELVKARKIRKVLLVSRWSIHQGACANYLAQTVQKLANSGKVKVGVLRDVPFPGDEAPRRYILRHRLHLSTSWLELTRDSYRTRNLSTDELFSHLLNTSVLDTDQPFLNSSGRYDLVLNRDFYYVDSTHLSRAGAHRLRPVLEGWLMD